ncbi:hypothetical protein sscle_14g099900 [Sclerotinia sclerotiorum 1980 UF-70]|nr:hypothetical protein sscle_14g099900 [Sclerotinia sclerotiorum 1980 UF-70]
MHLRKFLAVLFSLAVVGLSTPVVSKEQPPNTTHNNIKPIPTIPTQAQTPPKAQEPSQLTNKNTIQSIQTSNTIIEGSLNRKTIDESLLGIILELPTTQTRVMEWKKRGDETVVWVQPPPTSKMHPPV